MKNGKKQLAIVLLVLALGFLILPGADAAKKNFYAVEINGVVCGYSETAEVLRQEAGRQIVQLETNVFVMLSLLGSEFNSRIHVTAQLDPATRRVRNSVTVIDQGDNRVEFKMTISGDEAKLVSPRRSETKKIAVYPGLLIGGDEVLLHLKQDFIERRLSEASYDILEMLEEEVQRSTFRKVGEEKLELAGKTFATLVIEQYNNKTGVKSTFWLAPEQDGYVKFTIRDRSVYLADRRIVDRIKVADMDASIFTQTNVAIVDVPAIVYMKLKVKIAPTGIALNAADLNVPGQSFSGTVKDNVIEGIMEIEPVRYDGANAPPLPPRFESDPLLRKYLQPERFIESDDPVLRDKALEITAAAGDSWQAARRLSQWVAENIAYTVIPNNSARNAYNLRAGECGAHSMLLTAFCRSLGIPARMVYGAMYVSNRGGGFGQHAWNEIYMGPAGWVPVDSTAYETDYIDAGHIRISEVKSATSSSFNGKEITVLEHRLAGKAASAAIAQTLAPFLGRFAHPQGSRTITVLEKEGNLALDIPQKMVLPFNGADEKGRWMCKFAPHIYLVFVTDETGCVVGMKLHQIVSLPRKVAAADAPAVSGDLAPYTGVYLLPAEKAEFTVQVQDNGLVFHDPLRKKAIKLLAPGSDGGWREESGENTIFFEKDGQGQIVTMKVDTVDSFQRGEHAADVIEAVIREQGLEAGLRQVALLKASGRQDVFFSESAFNDLGYRYLAAGQLQEAIAVLRLNVEAYPASFNAYDSLGEAYMKNNQNDLALLNFGKSLELNPQNENAKKMIEAINAR